MHLKQLFFSFSKVEKIFNVQGETELSFRFIPSLTQSHTKPRTETVREEVILAKEGISLKDNSVSPCTRMKEYAKNVLILCRFR